MFLLEEFLNAEERVNEKDKKKPQKNATASLSGTNIICFITQIVCQIIPFFTFERSPYFLE